MFKIQSSVDIMKCLVFSLIAVLSFSCSTADELEQIKPRRGGTVGLFAFPRVGRSDASLYSYKNYGPVQSSYEEYDDLPKAEWKRNQGLVPFPRVGRAENHLRKWSKLAMQQDMDKRTGPASANSGLWFGPRLGRIQKRAADAGDNRMDIYTPRLGRESEELLFDEFANTGSDIKTDYVDMFRNLENYLKNKNIKNKIYNKQQQPVESIEKSFG